MTRLAHAIRTAPLLRPEWIQRIVGAALVIGVGVLLGLQYIDPNKRVVSVLVGLLVFGIAWRVDMTSGLGILALALPFPKGTVFGNTNLAFVLLLLVIWLLRVTTRQSAAPRRTPVDAPIVALFIAYVLSFYNVERWENFQRGIALFQLIAASMLLFFLVTANLRSERDFRRFLGFQSVAVAMVCLLAVWELNHPGSDFIPGWITFRNTVGTEFNTANVRVGSSFYDFELLSEFCAINVLLVMFLFMRAERMAVRVAYGALLTLVVFVLFATVTRGAMTSLGIATVYFLWHVRRRLNIVTFVIVACAVVALFFGMDWYVSHFTRSGDVVKRFEETKFVGWMPESRAGAWTGAWNRMLEHPLLGHGPYYSAQEGTKTWTWPHCLYLFIGNNVGFIGLGIFLWLLYTLWKISRPRTDDLKSGSYLESYRIIAHVQILVFAIDQIKIEYLRNPIYQFQVWLMFALVVAAHQISVHAAPERVTEPRRRPALAPAVPAFTGPR